MTVTESGGSLSEPKRSRAKLLLPVVLIGLLLLALLVSNLLYTYVTQRKIVLTGAPGALLYVATFDGFTDEWDLYAGQQNSSIVDERIQISVASPLTAGWSTSRHQFLDFDIKVTAAAIDGPIDNAFGIVFGMQSANNANCQSPAIILCGLSQWLPLVGAALGQVLDPVEGANYYAFMISSDGYYSLRQIIDGEQMLLSAWIPSEAVRQNLHEQNSIRVVSERLELAFYVNGERMMLCLPDGTSATSTYAAGECISGNMRDRYQSEIPVSGKLGVIVEATQTGGGGVTVQFDDVIVVSPGYPSIEDAKA